MTVSSRWQWSLVLLGTVCASASARAVEVHPPLENKITQALKTKHAVDFVNVPLSEAIKQLAAAANVPYRLDWLYEEKAVPPDTPITLQRDEQEIAETLVEVLSPLSLQCDVQEDALIVTASGDERFSNRFFDVSRLVQLIKTRLTTNPVFDSPFYTRDGFSSGFGAVNEESTPQHDFPMGLCAGSGPLQPPSRRKADFRIQIQGAQHRFPAEYRLMSLVQENTGGQWEEVDMVGGTMMTSPGRLLVRQTNRIHQQAFVVLSNLQVMLSDPKKYPRLRIVESEEERGVRVALDRILDTISETATGTVSLQTWMDENIRPHGVAIRIDQATFDDEAIAWSEVRITLVPGATRRKLFFDALDRANLSLVFFNSRYVITSLAKADEALTTMAYDISELPESGDINWLADYLFQTTSGQWEMVDGVGGTVTNGGITGLLIVRQTDRLLDEVAEKLDDLRRPLEIPATRMAPARTQCLYALPDIALATDLQPLLPKLVDLPNITWPEGSIERVGSLLIIRQTEVAHRRIEEIVEAIRTAHRISVSIELRPSENSPESKKETTVKPGPS